MLQAKSTDMTVLDSVLAPSRVRMHVATAVSRTSWVRPMMLCTGRYQLIVV